MQQQLMQMIGQLGTPAARELLLKLRDEAKDDTRRDYCQCRTIKSPAKVARLPVHLSGPALSPAETEEISPGVL